MATTYEPIATTTLSSAAASITFSSISSAYTDLRLVFNTPAQDSPGGQTALQFNSNTSGLYSVTYLEGDGSSANSSAAVSQSYLSLIGSTGGSATLPMLIEIDIFSYAGSTYKTVLATKNGDRNGTGTVTKIVGLWRSTSAINTIKIFNSGNNYTSGTIATLYGILKA